MEKELVIYSSETMKNERTKAVLTVLDVIIKCRT